MASPELYAAKQAKVAEAAKQALAGWLAANPDATPDDLAAEFTRLAGAYGDASAELAVEWYAEGRAAVDALPAFEPAPAAALPDGYLAKMAAGLNDAALLGALGQAVQQRGRDTITHNTHKDPAKPRWARKPIGKTCAWCLMLASRGAVYFTEATAGGGPDAHTYHRDCDCQPVPVFPGQQPPYDADALYSLYLDAKAKSGSGQADAIAAQIRQDHPGLVSDATMPPKPPAPPAPPAPAPPAPPATPKAPAPAATPKAPAPAATPKAPAPAAKPAKAAPAAKPAKAAPPPPSPPPREFGDKAAAKRWADQAMPKLTDPREIDAAHWYTYQGDVAMNRTLRGTFSKAKAPADWTDQKIKDGIANLDKAMARSTVPEPVIVHRGTGIEPFLPYLGGTKDLARMVGQYFADPGYLSTALGGSGFGGRAVTMRITLPKGTHAAWIQPHSVFPKESEMLLARGTRIEITRVTKTAGNTWLVEGTAIP